MMLNKVSPTSNMYSFLTHTGNAIKGSCSHNCSYCYMKTMMKKFKCKQEPAHLRENELKGSLGSGKFIFVGSSTDMFAADIPGNDIQRVLDYCNQFENKYLLQTKFPERYQHFKISNKFTLGTTIETNRIYDCMGETPDPLERALAIGALKNHDTFVTVEPVLDFDFKEMSSLLEKAKAKWINFGADSGKNGLPEPTKDKLELLISSLSGKAVIKRNMERLR